MSKISKIVGLQAQWWNIPQSDEQAAPSVVDLNHQRRALPSPSLALQGSPVLVLFTGR